MKWDWSTDAWKEKWIGDSILIYKGERIGFLFEISTVRLELYIWNIGFVMEWNRLKK